MATIYVDSNASGANDGTSWTDAYESVVSAAGVAAGSEVWAERNHVEQPAAHTTYSFTNSTPANPVKLLCVDKADDSLVTSGTRAVIGTNTSNAYVATFSRSLISVGIKFFGGVVIVSSPQGSIHRWRSEHCEYQSYSAAAVQLGDRLTPFSGELIDCQFHKDVNSGSWIAIPLNDASRARIVRPTFDLPGSFSTALITPVGVSENTQQQLIVEDADLSAFSLLVDIQSLGRGRTTFRRCVLKSGYALCDSTPLADQTLALEQCAVGTLTLPPLGLTSTADHFGTVTATLSRYRTGGADDGEQANAYSWEMATNSNAVEIYSALESPPLTRWVEPDASISGATAQGVFTTTRCAPLATPAALTTDSGSTWNGTGVSTMQKIEHVLTNGDTLTVYVASGGTLNNDDFWVEISEPDQVGGPVSVRCFLAKPSTTVYVDPVAVISGQTSTRQWFSEGVQIAGGDESGGGGGGTGGVVAARIFTGM